MILGNTKFLELHLYKNQIIFKKFIKIIKINIYCNYNTWKRGKNFQSILDIRKLKIFNVSPMLYYIILKNVKRDRTANQAVISIEYFDWNVSIESINSI